MPFPVGNLGLVALDGSFLRLLAGEAHPTQQVPQMAALLLGIELAWPSQFAALESIAAVFCHTLLPGGYRLPGHAQLPRYFRLGHPACKQLAAPQSSLLQCLEIPLVLHSRSSKRTQAN